ncbi:MAG: enoyl-CoA hydratase/isomerase family protein [Acidimicrobiales bacterium]|nr:enoyl-CoA hydratase/isomerase family protein [Myxococcales bacterium]MCB1003752.1 enoyl-CoA hydratase/isomerase family protein [Acidimicrobiales bacterium]
MLVTVQGETTAVWRATLGSDGERAPVLSRAGIEALVSLCERAAAPGSPCRVIVLDSTPAGFCRGMDLDALAEDPAEQAEQGVALYADMLARLREARAAVIAVVRGEALAGGLGLLCAADHVIAEHGSSFALPETTLGLVPAMVLPLLMERMPPQKARHLALFGERLYAQRALELGLVDMVCSEGHGERALKRVVKALLRCEPGAVSTLKALSGRVAPLGWRAGLSAGAETTRALLEQPSVVANVTAFVKGGEAPPWFARWRPNDDGGSAEGDSQ